MTSDVIANNYSNNSDILYGAHYITLASDSVSYENPTGKFIMQYVMPNVNQDDAFNRTYPKNSTSNVVNKDILDTTNITMSNYIELTVPKHLFYITDLEIEKNTYSCSCTSGIGQGGCNPVVKITRKEYSKGQQFIIVNAGGNIDSPCIVGVV